MQTNAVKKVLVLGATGLLGRPVVHALVQNGIGVKVLTRNPEKARNHFGPTVEAAEGSALIKDHISSALTGCDAVHISLPQDTELKAMRYVTELVAERKLSRVTYVSATSVFEENRWFELVDIKLRTEEILWESGLPYTIFCPTWVMDTLKNFVRGDRAVMIIGKNPPPLHFFAASDFGRMVADSYKDERSLGKRLFIHGPEGVTLPDALKKYFKSCYPNLNVMKLKLWQAQLFAKLTGKKNLKDASQLIGYFDKVGEPGDPYEANQLLGKPVTTLEDWIKSCGSKI